MSQPIYIAPNDLPPIVLAALRDAGCPVRQSIPVYVSETESLAAPSGDGCKGFATLIDLDTNDTRTVWGSWGGGNPFSRGEHDAVDHDTKPRPLPVNGLVVKGYIGGASGGHASITVHPARAAKLLPEQATLTDRERHLLAVYAGLNSRGRKEYFERNPESVPTLTELQSLAVRGFIKLSKAGAVTITPDGRNNRAPRLDY
jgi:hypothetical protein